MLSVQPLPGKPAQPSFWFASLGPDSVTLPLKGQEPSPIQSSMQVKCVNLGKAGEKTRAILDPHVKWDKMWLHNTNPSPRFSY